MLSRFTHVWLFVTLWMASHQAPLSMGFSRQEYWSGLTSPPPGDLYNPGIEPTSLESLGLAGGFFTTSCHLGSLWSNQIVWTARGCRTSQKGHSTHSARSLKIILRLFPRTLSLCLSVSLSGLFEIPYCPSSSHGPHLKCPALEVALSVSECHLEGRNNNSLKEHILLQKKIISKVVLS